MTLLDRGTNPIAHVDRRLAVVILLQSLPRRRRQCVILPYFVDLSAEETAYHLGVTVGTVKGQTARALVYPREALRESGLDIEPEETS